MSWHPLFAPPSPRAPRALAVAALAAGLLVAAPAGAQSTAETSAATAVRKKTVKKKTVTKKKPAPRKTNQPAKRPAPRPAPERTPVVQNLLDRGTIGLKLGFNASWTLDDSAQTPDLSLSSSAGFQGGVAYDKAINTNIGYRGELLYIQKGGSRASEAGSGSTEVTLGYVEVPVMLTFHADVSPTISPFVTVGGYASFLLSVDQLVDGVRVTTAPNARGQNVRIEDFYAPLDYGMNVGGGAYFVLSKTMIATAEIRYSHGFADIEDHDATGRPDTDRTNNRSFALMGGIHF